MLEMHKASLPARSLMLETGALHADDRWRRTATGDLAPPLHVSTTFEYPLEGAGTSTSCQPSLGHAYIYSREGQPTFDRVEAVLGEIEGGYAVTYSSGLAAAYAALTHFAPRRVAIRTGYHGTHATLALFSKLSPVEFLDIDDQLAPGDILWLESPMNPSGEIYDITAYAQKARACGATLIVDSTFAPPPLQSCLKLGANVVLHSCTKYLGGHSDLLGGALISSNENEAVELRNERSVLGSTMGSMESWLLLRSLRTLAIRVSQQSRTATELAEWLHKAASCDSDFDGIPAGTIIRVMHASVQETSFDKRKQMPGGYGAVFSTLLSSHTLASIVSDRLRLFAHATSLGAVESTIEWRVRSDPTVDNRLVRISVGLEAIDDLKADLRESLTAAWKELGCAGK